MYDTVIFTLEVYIFSHFRLALYTIKIEDTMSLRTRLFSASCEARSLFQVVSPDKLGHRLFQTSTGLERMVKSHYPDLSEKVEPELRVQDSVMGEGEPEVLRADPDAPSFEMQDPYVEAPPKCVLCEHQIPVDYKNVKLLSQFISHFTGCRRELTQTVGGGRCKVLLYGF